MGAILVSPKHCKSLRCAIDCCISRSTIMENGLCSIRFGFWLTADIYFGYGSDSSTIQATNKSGPPFFCSQTCLDISLVVS